MAIIIAITGIRGRIALPPAPEFRKFHLLSKIFVKAMFSMRGKR
jgi:hypothetical protein